jgi:ketosteroid isomerase-like protein
MRFAPWAAGALLLAAACAPKPETPEQATARMAAESDSAKTAIEAANARFIAHMQAGHADSAAMNYAEDALLLWPNEPMVRGRAAIQAKFAELLAAGSSLMQATTLRVDANGPMAVEVGTNVIDLTPGPNTPRGMAAMFPDTGKYVTYWKKTNGSWQIIADIGNTSRPMAPPPSGRH